MRRILVTLTVASLAVPALASAQPEPEPEPEPDDEGIPLGDEVEMTDDPVPEVDDDGELFGTSENPDQPAALTTEENAGEVTEKIEIDTSYPITVANRPLTLHGRMSEVFLDYPINVDPFIATGLLRASYGITDDIQVGLRYGLGAATTDGFETGKAVAIDGHYQIFEWLSAQLSLPLYLDPFAMGLTIGAPMKYAFADRFAIFGGHDMINVKLKKFFPVVENAALNEAIVDLEDVGTALPAYEIRILFGGIYQIRDDLALTAETGFIIEDSPMDTRRVPMFASVTYSFSNKVDLGGRLGFSDLDSGGDSLTGADGAGSFFVSVFAALRI